MADLPHFQARDFRNFLECETGKVVQIDHTRSLRLRLLQLLQYQPDFDDLLGALRVYRFSHGAIRRPRALQGAALQRQPAAGKIHQNPAHGAAGDGIEVLPVADLPAALVDMPEPDFIDEFRRRERRVIALLLKVPHRKLMEFGENLAQNCFRNFAIPSRECLELFGKGACRLHEARKRVYHSRSGELCGGSVTDFRRYIEEGRARPHLAHTSVARILFQQYRSLLKTILGRR